MTGKQRKKFSEIIDLNWEASHETNLIRKIELFEKLAQKKKELRDEMGHEEYDDFIENGRKMFSPKNS